MSKITKTFGGKERVFSFGLGFLGNLIEETDFTITNVDEKIAENPFRYIPLFIYHSLLYDVLRQKERPDFDIDNVTDWVEEAGGIGSEFVLDFFNNFRETMLKNVPQSNQKETKVSKKK